MFWEGRQDVFQIQAFAIPYLLFFILGLPLSQIFKSMVRQSILLAPALGIALSIVVVPIAYKYLATTQAISNFLWSISALSLIFALFMLRSEKFSLETQPVGWIILLFFAPALLPLAGAIAGGQNFQAWQLNTYDLSNYLTIAISSQQQSIFEIQSMAEASPRGAYAASLMGDRISSPVLMGAIQNWAGPNFRESHYGFILSVVVAGSLAAAALLRTFADDATLRQQFRQRILTLVVACAIAGGFFGQIYQDLNAWSAAIAFPLLIISLLSTSLVLLSESSSWRLYLLVGLSHTSLLFAYPEEFAATLLLELLVVTIFILTRKIRPVTAFKSYLVPLVLGASISLLFFDNTLRFLWRQATFTSAGSPEGWKIWAHFIFWRLPNDQLQQITSLQTSGFDFFGNLSSLCLGILGVSSATLAAFGLHFVDPFFGHLSGLSAIVLTISIIVLHIRGLTRRPTELVEVTKFRLQIMNVWAIAALGLILSLNFVGKNWEAFKATQWFGPLVAIAILFPVTQSKNWTKSNVIMLVLPILWLSSQLSYSMERVYSLVSTHSLTQVGPYPHDGSLRQTDGFRKVYPETFFSSLPWSNCETATVVLKDQQIQTFVETDVLSSGNTLVYGEGQNPSCTLLEESGQLVFESTLIRKTHKIVLELPYPSIISEEDYQKKKVSYLGKPG